MTPWRVWMLTSLLTGWIGLTSCTKSQTLDPYFCDVEPSYTKDGLIDPMRYSVNKPCLRGATLRLKACYKE